MPWVRIRACVRNPRNAPDWEGFRWVNREGTTSTVSLHCRNTGEPASLMPSIGRDDRGPCWSTRRGAAWWISGLGLCFAGRASCRGGCRCGLRSRWRQTIRCLVPNCIVLRILPGPNRAAAVCGCLGGCEGFPCGEPQNMVGGGLIVKALDRLFGGVRTAVHHEDFSTLCNKCRISSFVMSIAD